MRRTPWLVLLSLALVPGCASREKGADRVKVYPVEGKLLVLGRPAGEATVAFHAVDKVRSGVRVPCCITRANGTFRLTTYELDDGAPEGEFTITIYWPHDPSLASECACTGLTTHDRLFGLYSDPATSALRATIRPEHNEIVLQATVGGSGWNLPRLGDTRTPPSLRDPREGELLDPELRKRARELQDRR